MGRPKMLRGETKPVSIVLEKGMIDEIRAVAATFDPPVPWTVLIRSWIAAGLRRERDRARRQPRARREEDA